MSSSNYRHGEIIEVSEDKGPYKLVKVKVDGKEIIAKMQESYGIQAAPAKGSLCFIICPDGDEGRALAIIEPAPSKRTDKQKPGEVSYGNPETGSVIKHQANGDTIATSKGLFHINPMA